MLSVDKMLSLTESYIKLDDAHFEALKKAKADNYNLIYKSKKVQEQIKSSIRPMMAAMYDRLLDDLNNHNTVSPIYAHHIDYVNKAHYERGLPYESAESNQIVVDYIAGMTDDYFIDLFAYLFPDSEYEIKYKGYFE